MWQMMYFHARLSKLLMLCENRDKPVCRQSESKYVIKLISGAGTTVWGTHSGGTVSAKKVAYIIEAKYIKYNSEQKIIQV